MKTLSEIDFGDDVSLYRSAADTLQTNDTMVVGGPWGMQAKPIGRVSIASSLSDDQMLGVGSAGGANQFNTTNTVTGIGTRPQNGGIGQIYGLVVQPCSSPASATVNQIWGAHISVRVASATTILSNGRALFVATPTISAGGVITNAYGVEINPQATTGVGTAYGIYQRGTTDYNVLLGNTGMGVTAPTLSRLQFPAGTLAADGITWGTDVNLYRLSANVLRSDDQVSCVGADLNKNEALNLVTHKLAAAPASPVTGQRYHDTVTKTERFYDGTGWTTIADIAAVGPDAPTGTLNAGDLWYDTDEPNTLILPLGITAGGTGGTTALTARTSLAVPAMGNSTTTTGAPTTGTWARGDLWVDSSGVQYVCITAGSPGTWVATNRGEELAYNQITAGVSLVNGSGAQHLVIEGTSRTYDSGAIIVELYAPIVQAPGGIQLGSYLNLLDAGTDLGVFAEVYNNVATYGLATTVLARRRITPSVGTHNYRVGGWVNGGTGTVFAGTGTGGGGAFSPAYIRVTRA